MRDIRYIVIYVILVIAHIIMNNFFDLARYFLICVLPVLIIMLPSRVNVLWAMVIAFVTGFVVDFFSTGLLGLTSLALVPVALAIQPLTLLILGGEQMARGEDVTFTRAGISRIALSCLFACSLYFIIYVWADSAGTAGFWSALLRIFLSVVLSTPLCVVVAKLLRPL